MGAFSSAQQWFSACILEGFGSAERGFSVCSFPPVVIIVGLIVIMCDAEKGVNVKNNLPTVCEPQRFIVKHITEALQQSIQHDTTVYLKEAIRVLCWDNYLSIQKLRSGAWRRGNLAGGGGGGGVFFLFL